MVFFLQCQVSSDWGCEKWVSAKSYVMVPSVELKNLALIIL